MCCEKCWEDAYSRMRESGKSQVDCYYELLEERKYNPCTEQEQAGQFWDENKKQDKRKLHYNILPSHNPEVK